MGPERHPGALGQHGRDCGAEIWPITGYAENVASAKGFLQPGTEMITKPFDLDNLAQRIRGMVSG
jgi:hypothetical protein